MKSYLLGIQRTEQQNVLHRVAQSRALFIGLGENDFVVLLLLVIFRIVLFSKHRLSAARKGSIHNRLIWEMVVVGEVTMMIMVARCASERDGKRKKNAERLNNVSLVLRRSVRAAP